MRSVASIYLALCCLASPASLAQAPTERDPCGGFDPKMPYTINLNLATRAGADWLKGAVGDFFSEDFEKRMEAAVPPGSTRDGPSAAAVGRCRWGGWWLVVVGANQKLITNHQEPARNEEPATDSARPNRTAPEPVLRGLRDSVDVVSFNHYGENAPVETLRNIHRLTDRPIMLTEFSFKAMDSGLPNTKGAARPVATRADRAEGFTRYVHGLIDLPFVVGFHWFEHADEPKEGRFDGENSNYGLVTMEDRPWEVLVQKMTEVNAGLETRHARSAAKQTK